jgi:hypothetical protein
MGMDPEELELCPDQRTWYFFRSGWALEDRHQQIAIKKKACA